MDPRRSRKTACSSVLQQARRRFSATSNVEAIATPEYQSMHNKGGQRSFQCCDTSTIQHEFRDMEMQSLRQEVEQLRETLRLTTIELSAMHDKEKELQEERVLRLELKGECQNLKRNLEQYQAEGEEMLNDLLDSTVCVDYLKQKLVLKEEAVNQLEESYNKVNQERDEIVDEMCVSHVENGDLFYMREKMEHLQQQARHDSQRQAAEIAELQQRLERVSREQEEVEKRNAILKQHSIKQQRASRRASADAAVGSKITYKPGGQVSPCDSSLLIRRRHGRRRFSVRSEALTSLLTMFHNTDNIDDEKTAPTLNPVGATGIIDDGEQTPLALLNHVGAQIVAPMLPAAPQDTPTRSVLFLKKRGSLSCSDVIDAPILSRHTSLAEEFYSSARLAGLS
jgi:hypothetical protein